jgi:undecaprenyl-diphosphatase
MKQALGRERPLLHPALADFIRFDWSFPSGHATHAAAFSLILWLLARETGVARHWLPLLAFVVMLGVALSRLYLQVHWPSDVLAGVLLATVWAGLVSHALRPATFRGVVEP